MRGDNEENNFKIYRVKIRIDNEQNIPNIRINVAVNML
jgi:hypothetical protein